MLPIANGESKRMTRTGLMTKLITLYAFLRPIKTNFSTEKSSLAVPLFVTLMS